jgi:hypothetical protein
MHFTFSVEKKSVENLVRKNAPELTEAQLQDVVDSLDLSW